MLFFLENVSEEEADEGIGSFLVFLCYGIDQKLDIFGSLDR